MASTVEMIRQCLGTAIDLAPKVKFDAENIQHLYPVALYTSILELTDDCVYLVREARNPE